MEQGYDMSVGLVRRAVVLGTALAVTIVAAGCRGSIQAAGPDGIAQTPSTATTVTETEDIGDPVTVAPLTPDTPPTDTSAADAPEQTTSTPEGDTTPPGDTSAPGTTASSSSTPTTTLELPPAAAVTGTPELGSTDVAPGEPITITAKGGTIVELTFTNPEGKKVKGSLSKDRTSWKLGEPLGFGKTYTVTGVAVNPIGAQTEINATYRTATTIEPVTTTITPGDGAVVGVAMPVIVRFGFNPQDKALIEKHVKIVTEPKVEGSWAWITHDGMTYPSLDWRPKEYWPAGTKVHVESNIYGLKFADNWYGGDDVAVDFTIGRNQVVKANAKKNQVQVFRDGKLKWTFNGSFGRGDVVGDPNLVTRSGIHVVTSKHAEYTMSNPEYGYTDAKEYWAVRISNNGEFLHNNPGTSPWQLANANITHGCINLSWDDAKKYFDSAMTGDPVEITGTSIQLSAADGDIYDWTIPWKKWQTMSALAKNSIIE